MMRPNIGRVENVFNPGQNIAATTSSLPNVSDPEKVFAQITRDEYDDYVKNFRAFEMELLDKANTDTSLIDQAKADAAAAPSLSQGMADRNASRYGATLTPAQLKEQQRTLQIGSTLGSTQSIADARLAQMEANTGLRSDLINIGQGINRAAQNQLGSAAADANSRKQAYGNAKASAKAQNMSAVGSLASMAIMAFAF